MFRPAFAIFVLLALGTISVAPSQSQQIAIASATATPSPSPSPSPTPTAKPCVPSVLASGSVELFVRLKDRDTPCFQTPAAVASPLFSAGPGPATSEAAAFSGVPGSKGVSFTYYLPKAAPSSVAVAAPSPCPSGEPKVLTLAKGVPFQRCEPRVVIWLMAGEPTSNPSQRPGIAPAPTPTPPERVEMSLHRHVIVEVNQSGACYVRGAAIGDDQVANCTVATPAPARSADAPKAPQPQATWSGTVTVQLPLLNPALDPTVGVRPFQFCAFAATDDDAIVLAPLHLTAPETASCRWFDVDFVSEPQMDRKISPRGGTTAQQTQNDTSTSGASMSIARRRADASAGASGTNAKSAASPNSTVPDLVGTAVFPFNEHARISFEAQDEDLLSSIGNTATNGLIKSIGDVSTQFSGSSGLAFNGSQATSDDFGTIDADITQRVIPGPYRGFNESAISKTDARAFDSTDILDLNPFDPKQILRLSYGTTVSELDNNNATLGLTYFRDGSQNESGGLVHGDKTLFFEPLNVSFGYTHTVANDLYASTGTSNAYLTARDPVNAAFPMASDAPILHSANDVFGLGIGFGPNGSSPGEPAVSRDFTFLSRYGTNGIGHDLTEALSYQTDALDGRISANGTTLINSGLAGYRDISYAYDPLLSGYDPFAGNSLYFARLATQLSQPRCSEVIRRDTNAAQDDGAADPGSCPIGKEASANSLLSLSLVRANTGAVATYSGVGAAITAAINPTYSIDAVYMRSNIAGSVEGRITGKQVVIGNAASTFLDNNASSVSLNAKVDKILSLSAGVAFADKPSCTSATTCAPHRSHVPSRATARSQSMNWPSTRASRPARSKEAREPRT
jgi:hypothetical protein